jgi:hypothetical protein
MSVVFHGFPSFFVGDIDTIPTKSTQITRNIPFYKKNKYIITA